MSTDQGAPTRSEFTRALSRRYWSEAEARSVLSECEASGLSVERFCRAHGLGAKRLRWWKAKLTKSVAEPAAPRFLPVQVIPDRVDTTLEEHRGEKPIEIVVGGGRVIRVLGEFDPHVLRRMLAVLEETAC